MSLSGSPVAPAVSARTKVQIDSFFKVFAFDGNSYRRAKNLVIRMHSFPLEAATL